MILNLKKGKTESMVFGGSKRLNSHCGDLNIEYKMFLYLLSGSKNRPFIRVYKRVDGQLGLLHEA